MNQNTSSQNTSSQEMRALRITSQPLEHVTVSKPDLLHTLYRGIGCHTVDVVSLNGGIDVWVDDEGAINGSELDLPVTIICHVLGVHTAVFGTAIALGVDQETGDSTGLSPAQVQTLIGAIGRAPSPEVVDALCETLAPLPGIVALLSHL